MSFALIDELNPGPPPPPKKKLKLSSLTKTWPVLAVCFVVILVAQISEVDEQVCVDISILHFTEDYLENYKVSALWLSNPSNIFCFKNW